MGNNFFGNLFNLKKTARGKKYSFLFTRALPRTEIQRIGKLDQHSPYCIDAATAWESGAD